jgi:hypothetical protein
MKSYEGVMCCRDALKERLCVEEGCGLKIVGEKCTNERGNNMERCTIRVST